jgi:hypothetical protein
MKKIDITAGSNAGDNGPIAGEKLNDNFKELVQAAFGSDIWNGTVDEAVSLAALPTNNKSSLFAAIAEVYAKAANIDDSLTSSLFKTWSIDKLLLTFIDQTELDAAIANLVDSSPETLDTLNELAAALGDDPNFATTTATALGNRLRFDIDNQNLSEIQIANAITNLNLYNFFYTKAQIASLLEAKQDLIEVKIQGLIVQTAGKTDLTILENNDLFRYQTANRYVVGVILDATSITLPEDLDDINKIKLQYDA